MSSRTKKFDICKIKRKAGAPSKYRPEFDLLIYEYLSAGKSNYRFCADIYVCEKTFYNWLDEYPSFLQSYLIGQAVRRAIFMEKVDAAAWDSESNKANNGLIYMLAASLKIPIKPEEEAGEDLSSKISAELARIAAGKLL